MVYVVTEPQTDHIDLSVGVAHVADDAAVLHAVQVFPHHNIFIA